MNFSQTSAAAEESSTSGGELSLWHNRLALLKASDTTTKNTDADNEFFKKDPDHQEHQEPERGELRRCFSQHHYDDGHNMAKKDKGETVLAYDDDDYNKVVIIKNSPYKNWAGEFFHYKTNKKEVYYSCRNSSGKVFDQTEYVRIDKNYPIDYNLDILYGWTHKSENLPIFDPEEEVSPYLESYLSSPHIESYLSPQLESYYTAASYINNPEPERLLPLPSYPPLSSNESFISTLPTPTTPQRMETWSYSPQIHDDDDDDDIEPIESLKSINDMSSIEFKQHIKYIKCSIKSKPDISKMTSEEYSEYIQELREDY